MKSKVTIDIDWDNQPVIRIEYNESDDVRDKMVKRFMESFRGDSCWATFTFENTVSNLTANRHAIIRPIPPAELKDYHENMRISYENWKKWAEAPKNIET